MIAEPSRLIMFGSAMVAAVGAVGLYALWRTPVVHDVEVVSFAFEPAELQIAAGDQVRWQVQSGRHNVTAETQDWHSADLAQSGEFLVRFENPGTYDYFCSLHDFMRGRIVVAPGADGPAWTTAIGLLTVIAALIFVAAVSSRLVRRRRSP